MSSTEQKKTQMIDAGLSIYVDAELTYHMDTHMCSTCTSIVVINHS